MHHVLMPCFVPHCTALLPVSLLVAAVPSQSVLRCALEALLEGADMTEVSYSQLHRQLEAQFKVRVRSVNEWDVCGCSVSEPASGQL